MSLPSAGKRSTRVPLAAKGRRRVRTAIRWLLPVAAVAVFGLWTANPFLTLACFGVLAALILLTWRPGEPPVLAFAVRYQWLQVSTKVFHADVLGVPVATMFPNAADEEALWLSLAGLLALSVGMRVGMARLRAGPPGQARAEILHFPIARLFQAYFGLSILALAGQGFAFAAGGFAQSLLAGLTLKWFAFFLFSYAVLVKKRGYRWLALAIGLELVVGFTGYFSGFKDVFFVLAIVYLTAEARFTARNLARVASLVVLLVVLGVVWMAVKMPYRKVISGGESAQVVRLDFGERSKVMLHMLLDLDLGRLADGMEGLAERMAYVDYFGQVVFMVPRVIPFADGELWADAVRHVLTPRLLFPDKPILLSDSELTMRYTASWLGAEEEGTSVSMGYFAESYIDFGRGGMMVVIGAVGLAWGLMYRYFLLRKVPRVYAFAAAVTVLINTNQFEMHNVKLVGGLLMSFLVTDAFMRWILPFADSWVRRPSAARPVGSPGSVSPWTR